MAFVLVLSSVVPASAASQESWAVYMYICGSDLESEQGLASENLKELFKVSLPENVSFYYIVIHGNPLSVFFEHTL